MLTTTHVLDLTPGGVAQVINVSQYDAKSRILQFQLQHSEGSLSLPNGVQAAVRGTKPDGRGFDNTATISTANNTVTVTVTEQMTAVAGRVFCEIYLYVGTPATSQSPASSNYKQLATANFILKVERAALDKDTIKSDSDIRQLVDVIDRADEIVAAGAQADAAKARIEALTETVEDYVEQAATSEANAAASARAAAASAASADSAVSGALSDIEAAKNAAVGVVEGAKDTATGAINDAKDAAVGKIADDRASAVDAIGSAYASAMTSLGEKQQAISDGADTAIGQINNAKEAAVEDVTDAKVNGVNQVNAARESSVAAIDEAYERRLAQLVAVKSVADSVAAQCVEVSEGANLLAAQALEKAITAENESATIANQFDRMNERLNTMELALDDKFDDAYLEDGYQYFEANGVRVCGPLGPFAGGGGGGGSGSGGNNASFSATNTSGWASNTIAQDDECLVTFTWSSIENEIQTGPGTLTVQVNSSPKGNVEVAQGNVVVDISSYLSVGTNKVALTISDIYGNYRSFRMSVTVVALSLSSTFDTSAPYTGAFSFPYTPVGNVSKTVHFILDGNEIGTTVTSVTGRQQSYTIPQQSHGAHTLQCYFEAEINGRTVRSNELYYEIICVEPMNEAPIITSSFRKTTESQYNTINIDYTVYNPMSMTTDVTIKVNNAVASVVTVDRTSHVFSYRAEDAGQLTIQLSTGTQGQDDYASKSWTLTIAEVDIDIEAETEGLALYLNARGRSNGESTRDQWTSGNIEATLSGFNWRINGWLQDDDGVDILRLCDDARAVIPYKIFGSDFKQTGKTIEIEFATREVADYSSAIFSCYTEDGNGKRVGLKITPQAVYFDGHQTSISTLYKENEHIRLAITVEKQSDYRLILIYINGVASRAIQYASGERFDQLEPVNITIGSNACGIDIYNIRVYDQCLSDRQVLNNWIADTQIGSLMMERYARNNIYSVNGEITVATLTSNIAYMLFNVVQMPQYKGDKKTISGSYTDPVDGTKSFTFVNCQIDAQGTSSSVYYVKNTDMKFNDGFVMQNGMTAATYALRSGSIPFNRFVLKQDVASSEGANNTGLVMFYNDTCPYKTPEMLADPRVRWGIEGVPALLFEHNPDTGVTRFAGKVNFNLPKRCPAPLGYSGNMESWEVERNNTMNVQFRGVDFDTMAWDEVKQEYYPEWYDDFEARFPSDEWRDISKLREFAEWVVSTARDNATNETLLNNVTYFLPTTATLNGYSEDESYTVVEVTEGGTRTGYQITFTKDTPAYRLTKFCAEASDYLELDSFVYMYLFTEMFLMIDSRAKNLFIGFNGSSINDLGRTMDRKATAQPYDMDTAMGTNNSGVLTFGYSLEDTDTVSAVISGEGGSNAPVFNAQNSTLWCNLRDAFRSNIVTMYRYLRTNNIWSYEIVERWFEQHQSKWSEAIFNEDSRVKYLVPLIDPVTVDEDTGRLVRTDRYLTMLQGNKSEQRKWWLYNRFRYMDSKFNTGDASRTISMRLFNAGTLTITPAIDLYVGVSFGGGTTPSLQRTTANTPVEFEYVTQSGVTEMETWIYSADLIVDVGDLSGFYPNELDFSRATRLRRLKIGSNAQGYSNTNLTTLDVRNSGLLEHLDCRNCPRLAISVNLEGSPRLKEAYFDGTAITGVELADGATVETLHLPATITALTLLNLTKLEDLTVASYANVTRLMLANMHSSIVNPVTVLSAIPANSQVYIEGLYLECVDAAAIDAFFDLLDNMRGVTRERGVNGDWLYHDYDTAQVSGVVHTNSLTGAELAELQARYQYIDVRADHTTSYLTVKTWDGGSTIKTITCIDGVPQEALPAVPARTSTAQYSYTGVGYSRNMDAQAAQSDAATNVYEDRTIYAAYSRTVRTYTVTWKNANGTTLETDTNVPYGTMPTYNGATPTYNGQTSRGWTPTVSAVTGDVTYTASYLPTYTATFVLAAVDGGTTLYTQQNIPQGTVPTYGGATPTSSRGNDFTFSGWSPALTGIQANTTYTAVFASPLEVAEIADSWAEIVSKIEAGTATYKVGNYKDLDLGAQGVVRMQICGLSADPLASGSGNAKTSWISIETLKDSHRMNPDITYGTKSAASFTASGNVWTSQNRYTVSKAKATWTLTATSGGTLSINYKTSNANTSRNTITTLTVNGTAVATNYANTTGATHTVEVTTGDTVTVYVEYDLKSTSYSYYATITFSSTGTFTTDAVVENANTRGDANVGTGAIGDNHDNEMYTYLNNTIKPLIPEVVRNAIKPVTKYTRGMNTAGTAVNNVATTETVWIPNYREIFGGTSYETQGPVYSVLFPDANSRIKKNVSSGSAVWWWLRSAYTNYNFYNVYNIGNNSNYTAANSGGVALGFCI